MLNEAREFGDFAPLHLFDRSAKPDDGRGPISPPRVRLHAANGEQEYRPPIVSCLSSLCT